MATIDKECTACGITKPITEFRFSKASGMYYGHCYKCFISHRDEYVKSEPTVTIPVSQFNKLVKDSQKLMAIMDTLA